MATFSSANPFDSRGRRAAGSSAAVVLAAAAAVLPAGRSAGQPASDAPRVSASAEVSLLGVEVVVRDRNGKPVHGLQAADFELLHGGRPVAVTNFHEERELAESPRADGLGVASAAGETASVRLPRRIVVFVDRLYLPEPSRRGELFDGVKGLLARSLTRPGDEAMVVSWGDYARVVRSFTGDLDALDATLDAVSRRVARLDSQWDELAELASRDFRSGSVSADQAGGAPAGSGELSPEIADLQAWGLMKARVSALRGLVALMAGMEGRKSLVLVSDRFGRWPGGWMSDGRDGRILLERLAEAANASGVTLYGVYPQEDTTGVAWMNQMAGLDFVAERTGGTTSPHPGLLPRFLDQVAGDLGSFYSLGFPAPGATRPESVKVRVKREGLTARTRATVAERTAEQQLTDRALANLFAPDPSSRIGISVVAGEAKPAGKKYRIPLEVRIPTSALVRLPGPASTKGKFSVFVVAATPKGDFSEVTRRRQAFEVKPGEETRADGSHLTYTLEVESDAPAPRISLAVWDEIGGEAGFALVGMPRG